MHKKFFSRQTSSKLFSIAFALLVGVAAWSPVAATQNTDGRGLALSKSGTVTELPARAKRYAIIIGVDAYADTQLSTLGGSSNDAAVLSDTLIRYAGFPADQVILLSSDQPAERQPTRGNILRRLSNLTAVVPKDALFVFAFAGHGAERGGQAFLLPSDAQLSDDITLLEQTAVNVLTVKEWVRKTGVGQIMMLLDACRNDPGGRADAPNPLTKTYTRGFNFDVRNKEVTAFATIYATGLGQRAYEYREKRHGYFTWAVIEALKGGAANPRGEVTLASMIEYLQERVPKQVLIDLGPGKNQVPWAMVEGYKANDLVLAVKGTETAPATKTATTPKLVPGETPIANAPNMPNQAAPSQETLRARGIEYGETLEGTTWTGATVNGEFEIEFLKDGKLRYTLLVERGEPRPIGGKWRRTGNTLLIDLYYSVTEATIDGGVIRGQGQNMSGEKFSWTLFPKQK